MSNGSEQRKDSYGEQRKGSHAKARQDVTDLSDEERQIERLLAELAPRDSRLSRDRTMFRAGQASSASRTTTPRSPRWTWPAVTVCSTAAGLAIGLFIAGPGRPAAPIVRQTSETSPATPLASVEEQPEAGAETIVADSPTLLDLRIALARRAGDEFTLAQSDLSANRGRAAAVADPVPGSFAPLTYGAALGRLHADEKDL